MNDLIYFLPVILVHTLSDFAKKEQVQYLNYLELSFFKQLSYFSILSFIFVYIYFNNYSSIPKTFNKYSNLPLKIYLITFGMSFLALMALYCVEKLLKKLDVSYYHPFKDALSSILLLFLAYFVFNEKLKTNRIIGALLITVGIFVMH